MTMGEHAMVDRVKKDKFYAVVGEAIRKARAAAGVSQRKLAAAATISLSTLVHAEDGMSCSLLVLSQIAEALDTTLDELVPTEAL